MLGFLLVVGLAFWSWLGNGPRFLRWPLVLVFLLMIYGREYGGLVSDHMDALAAPVLTLVIMIVGFLITLRGFGWRPRQRRYRYRGRWYDDRW
jgi:hypothetical protein